MCTNVGIFPFMMVSNHLIDDGHMGILGNNEYLLNSTLRYCAGLERALPPDKGRLQNKKTVKRVTSCKKGGRG